MLLNFQEENIDAVKGKVKNDVKCLDIISLVQVLTEISENPDVGK